MIWHVQPHAVLVYMAPAQRWFMLQNIGPSPSRRQNHAMASNGTRVFVLGGESYGIDPSDERMLVHVLDTSRYFFGHFIWTASKFEMQSSSNTRSHTPTLSSLVRRPSNSRGSHLRFPQLRSNHNARRRLRCQILLPGVKIGRAHV